MTIFDEVRALVDAAKARPPSAGQLLAPNPYTSGGVAGPISFPGWPDRTGKAAITDEQRARVAVTNEWAYSCIRVIADKLSTANLMVKRREGEGTTEEYNHPLERVWDNPNPFMGRSFLMRFWAWQFLLFGEGYLFFAPRQGTSEIAEIWPLPSVMVCPVAEAGDFITYYKFTPNRARPDKWYRLDPAYVVYSRIPHPFDIRRGLSPLVAAYLAISTDQAQAAWNRNFFSEKSGIPTAVISVPQDTSNPDFERARAELFSFFGGTERRAMLARAGTIDVKLLTYGHKEMDFVEGQRVNQQRIERAFGIPGGYFDASANRANAQHAESALVNDAVWPHLVALQEDLNAQAVRTWYGDDLLAEFEDIRPTNTELELQKRDTWASYRTTNELRAEDGLEPLRGAIWDTAPNKFALSIYEAEAGKLVLGGEIAPPETVPALAAPIDVEVEEVDEKEQGESEEDEQAREDLKKWRAKAIKEWRARGKPANFTSEYIPASAQLAILNALHAASTLDEVKAAFNIGGRVAASQPPFSLAGKATPDGSLSQRLDIEQDASKKIERVLASQLASVLPEDATLEQVQTAADKLEGASTELESATREVLLQASALGIEAGREGLLNVVLGVDWALANKAARDWAEAYTFELVRGINATSKDVLQEAVAGWVESGAPLPELRKELAPLFGEARAKLIASTETTRAYAEGNRAAWRVAGINRVEWQTAADERVCKVCGPLQSEKGDLEEGIRGVMPPAHPGCRCWLTPVVEA